MREGLSCCEVICWRFAGVASDSGMLVQVLWGFLSWARAEQDPTWKNSPAQRQRKGPLSHISQAQLASSRLWVLR